MNLSKLCVRDLRIFCLLYLGSSNGNGNDRHNHWDMSPLPGPRPMPIQPRPALGLYPDTSYQPFSDRGSIMKKNVLAPPPTNIDPLSSRKQQATPF